MKKFIVILSLVFGACSQPQSAKLVVPAMEYTKRLKAEIAGEHSAHFSSEPKASLHFVSDKSEPLGAQKADEVSNMNAVPAVASDGPGFTEYRSSMGETRDYTGPLSLGDPGVSSSLWKETRAANDIYRDERAWQPMDLITIVVLEDAEGKKSADTEIKEKSSILASVTGLLGFEDDITKSNPNVETESLLKASTQNDFKGEGKTNRKDTLKAKISAMVIEVLPSGIMRVEGERIISVNKEEQVMVISGLVRPRDISSANEVDSSRIANMRIDYYGRGTVGEAQSQGWLGRIVRKVWPF